MKSIIGTWQLIKTSATNSRGESLPAPYGGDHAMALVSFNEAGRMICVLYDSRPEIPAGGKREYNSYCGAFTFDGKRLSTAVDASSNQAWFGTDQVRDATFEGDTLVLRPPLRAYSGEPEQRVLYWRKIA
ncbi:MAG: lipocalin-like domain-containing protein [Burkholderiaceae bacterium]